MWILGKLIRLFLEQNGLNFMSKSQRLACLFYMEVFMWFRSSEKDYQQLYRMQGHFGPPVLHVSK